MHKSRPTVGISGQVKSSLGMALQPADIAGEKIIEKPLWL
jgi:hypothetical protein